MDSSALQQQQQQLAWACAQSSSGLKRTISKCSMDDDALFENSNNCSNNANESDGAALKKLAQVSGAAAVLDYGEPVLLPRSTSSVRSSSADNEPESSPPVFGTWTDDSPAAMKHRYYETLMDSTFLASPSPHHMMYAMTPGDSASTVSLDSQLSLDSEREFLSPATLHAILLDYLSDVFAYYSRAKGFTFQQLAQSLTTAQSSFRYIQSTVKVRLGVTWQLVETFVENALDFISDEDIRDATVLEFATFLREQQLQTTIALRTAGTNIFANLCEFVRDVLWQFKRYLAKLWVALARIRFPCEFGKKSETLFLCMECHREHR